jgi:membrane protease YdiL (CAAX protease family)
VTVPLALTLIARRSSNLSFDVLAADVLIGPFAEEVLFRGVLFLGLRRAGWSFVGAAVASALCFGVAHVIMPIGILATAAGGLLFAWVVDRWGSLWPAIGLHAGLNLWSDLVWGEGLRGSVGGAATWFWALGSCATLALVIGLTMRLAPARREPVRPTADQIAGARLAQMSLFAPFVAAALTFLLLVTPDPYAVTVLANRRLTIVTMTSLWMAAAGYLLALALVFIGHASRPGSVGAAGLRLAAGAVLGAVAGIGWLVVLTRFAESLGARLELQPRAWLLHLAVGALAGVAVGAIVTVAAAATAAAAAASVKRRVSSP